MGDEQEITAEEPAVTVEEVAEQVAEEVKEAVEEAVEETVEEAFDNAAEDFADLVAEKVYDKVKKFAEELVTATQDAALVAANSAPIDNTPAPEATETPEEDVRPERRHAIFRQPFKRDH